MYALVSQIKVVFAAKSTDNTKLIFPFVSFVLISAKMRQMACTDVESVVFFEFTFIIDCILILIYNQ